MPQEQLGEHDAQRPRTRIIVSCPHSGLGLLKHSLGLSLSIGSTWNRPSTSPPEPIIDSHASANGKDILFYQDELGKQEGRGNATVRFKEWMQDSFFSFDANLHLVVFVRDPVRVFDTWKHAEGESARISELVDSYTAMFDLMDTKHSKDGDICCYERLIQDSCEEVRRLLDLLEAWPPGEKSSRIGSGLNLRSMGEERDMAYHDLLSNGEKSALESALGHSYLVRCWKDETNILHSFLLKKTWFAFDLDDTLHEFRRASGEATTAVLKVISERYGISMIALKDSYSIILKQKTTNAFPDGKTSHDYRKERFTAVLAYCNLLGPEAFEMQEYLNLYERTLVEALELKCGALSLLKLLKAMEKKIAIITEGPQDAQERTMEALGIARLVDFLATTNRFGVSKTSGLFAKVLNHLQIASQDVVYVGDSNERDVVPARAERIFTIHLDESRNISFDITQPRVNTLHKLELILAMQL